MADVFAARADEFFSTWHRQRVAHEGPILDDDLFAEFVRQSFHLDLDDLVGVPELYVRSASEKSHEDAESVVGEVSKETALLLAGAEDEVEPEPMIVVQPYDENVGEWARVIALWMQQQKLERVGFVELLDGVDYPVVKGWLAVLLDEGFAMDRLEGSEFYRGTGILVALKREEIAESLCKAIAC
jgi:DNA-binding transcriptional ArsR family regulator